MATNKKPITGARSRASPSTRPRRMVQNFHLVWLDGNIDEVNSDDYRNYITKLRQIVNTVNTFTDADECIDFINSIEEEKTFMIFPGFFGQTIVPIVHDKPQVNTICIFCGNKARHEKWTTEWPKIKGVYTDINPICEVLKQAAQDCDHNSISISFVKTRDGASKESLDTLDSSFMYTQILKEILLTIEFEQSHINEFLIYCREQFSDNRAELNNIDKFEKEYRDHQPIWWYTFQCFLYPMLNRALRLMEVDLIIKMGFFVRDLHNHLAKLHTEQYDGHYHSNSLTIYRGQGLSQTNFEQLIKTQGGLLSFNNFLSTSLNRDVSLEFAKQTIQTSNLVGVLFVMKIDPSIIATPFANVESVGYYPEEKEILFSMHSVFRIGHVEQIDKIDRLWQVDLTLTGDNDPQLRELTERMRKETSSSYKGWHRLTKLMIQLGQFNKAEELCDILLQQTDNQGEKAHLFYQLGWIKNSQGKYSEAIEFYQKVLEIRERTLSADHPDLANSYNNIGSVYDNIGEYSKAISYYQKALEIQQKTLSPNHSDLATSYNNIGLAYKNMGEYSKALSYYEKDFEISQKTLPANHPELAISYNNMGNLYDNMGEYSKALSYYEKDLEISQKSLPADHPDLATSYHNMGNVYDNLGEYSKALSYYEKALQIKQKALPENHSSFSTSYNNIGFVYNNMGEYSKALSYFERALDIKQRSLPPNHPSIKSVIENIQIIKNKL